MRLTAQEVYDKLINEDQILTLTGQIKFYLGDVSIIVKQRDVVGNIMQEWLQGWLEARDIEYAPSENTQMPPDFYLNPDDLTKNLLEVKAFNRNAGPGFDIADFRMYEEEIIDKPYMLDVDYLVFGYDMSDEGVVTIKDVWLKKVWEITRRMEDWPLNLQIKDNVVHKIRPGIWYDNGGSQAFSIFESLQDFISAIEETMYQNPKTHAEAGMWKARFLTAYEAATGSRLVIPRWDSIKDKYDLKHQRKVLKAQDELAKAIEAKQKQEEKVAECQATLAARQASGTENQKAKAAEKLAKAEQRLVTLAEKIEAKEAALNALAR